MENFNKKCNQFYLSHSKIDVLFKPTKDDFVVSEEPLYDFSGEGDHLVVKFRKKDLTSWDAFAIFSNTLGCNQRDIGYAGLKDKNAMTIQYITIPKSYETKLKTFEHKNIKILDTTYHNNKLKIGHLKGNRFFIRLKMVNTIDSRKLEQVIKTICDFGIPNYFGVQRFGIDGNNHKRGQAILEGKLKERKKSLKQMYINSYQSYLFNLWLSKRVEISKLIDSFEANDIYDRLNIPLDILKSIKKQPHLFKLLPGDIMNHYPFGKIFTVEDLNIESNRFFERDIVPTGLLIGEKVKNSIGLAYEYEKKFTKNVSINGTRRFAWVFPSNMKSEYKDDKKHFELEFFLPKGSYATALISELIH
jgi:tRNA pseudouridine13 synthase